MDVFFKKILLTFNFFSCVARTNKKSSGLNYAIVPPPPPPTKKKKASCSAKGLSSFCVSTSAKGGEAKGLARPNSELRAMQVLQGYSILR